MTYKITYTTKSTHRYDEFDVNSKLISHKRVETVSEMDESILYKAVKDIIDPPKCSPKRLDSPLDRYYFGRYELYMEVLKNLKKFIDGNERSMGFSISDELRSLEKAINENSSVSYQEMSVVITKE